MTILERAARHVFKGGPDCDGDDGWEDLSSSQRQIFLEQVQLTLTAIRSGQDVIDANAMTENEYAAWQNTIDAILEEKNDRSA